MRQLPRLLQPLRQAFQRVLTRGLVGPDMRQAARSRDSTGAHPNRAVGSIEVVIGSRVSDEADLAVQQLSELKLVPGIELVGPLPLHLQPNPAVFSAGRMAASQRVMQSDTLLKYLSSPAVAPVLRESGLEP